MGSYRALPALDLDFLMGEALREAEAAGEAGELPIGAVVALGGEVVSRGQSRRKQRRTKLAHAELEALLTGGESVFTRHDDAVLVSTVEPCPLCLGAAVMADVPHIIFAAHDASTALPASVRQVPYVRRHIATYQGGIREEDSLRLIRRYSPELAAALSAHSSSACEA